MVSNCLFALTESHILDKPNSSLFYSIDLIFIVKLFRMKLMNRLLVNLLITLLKTMSNIIIFNMASVQSVTVGGNWFT